MDLKHRKTLLRKITNGIYIVTSRSEKGPTGAVVSFLTQSSINPPLITLAIRQESTLNVAIRESKYLAIHFVDRDQEDIIASFFKIREQDEKSINGYSFQTSDMGNPLLNDAPMILEAKVVKTIPGGDHHLFVCEVINTILRRDVEPLAMHHTNWHYGG